MNIVNNYADLDISRLQQTRLYMQGRPLIRLWRKQRNHVPVKLPSFVSLIKKELTENYIALDCAGWYFDSPDCQCTAIEIMPDVKRYWANTYIEYDYLSWCPTYLPLSTVLAYYSSYFKYSSIADVARFFNVWGQKHKKLIIGLDPTKIKFNYLKYDFLNQVIPYINFEVRSTVLEQSDFHLLFTIEKI